MTEQTTTIALLKNMPTGTKAGGFEFAIKTKKKLFKIGDDWIHTLVLCDKTGDMLADVNIGKGYKPITTPTIHITVSEVQDAELNNKPVKKLYIDQFTVPTFIGEPPELSDNGFELPDWEKIAEGKIRHGLVNTLLRTGEIKSIKPTETQKIEIEKLIEYIVEGIKEAK